MKDNHKQRIINVSDVNPSLISHAPKIKINCNAVSSDPYNPIIEDRLITTFPSKISTAYHQPRLTRNQLDFTYDQIDNVMRNAEFLFPFDDINFTDTTSHKSEDYLYIVSSLQKLLSRTTRKGARITLYLNPNNIPIYELALAETKFDSNYINSHCNIKFVESKDVFGQINTNALLANGTMCPILIPSRYLYHAKTDLIKKNSDKIICQYNADCDSKYVVKMKEYIDNFAERINARYHLENMDELARARFIYRVVVRSIKYDIAAANSKQTTNGISNYDYSASENPYLVIQNGKGICTGESALYEVLLNNEKINVNATSFEGSYKGIPHEWVNILVDGKRYEVCLTMHHFGEDLQLQGYRYDNTHESIYPFGVLQNSDVRNMDINELRLRK